MVHVTIAIGLILNCYWIDIGLLLDCYWIAIGPRARLIAIDSAPAQGLKIAAVAETFFKSGDCGFVIVSQKLETEEY